MGLQSARQLLTLGLASILLLLPLAAEADVRLVSEVKHEANGTQTKQTFELLVEDLI